MLDASAAITKAGGSVVLYNPWEPHCTSPIVHHWGMGYAHVDNIAWAKRHGQRVVMTVLVSYYSTLAEHLRGVVGRRLFEGRIAKRTLQLADRVVVVNESQAEVVHHCYGVVPDKVRVIPNIVADYITNGYVPKNNGDYWICSGTICKRKNQLTAAMAAIMAQIKLIIVGAAQPGEEDYAKRLESLVALNPQYLQLMPRMDRHSEQYISLLRNARGLLLPSLVECQPIIALEMMALRKPVILGDKTYARQNAFDGASRVDVGSATIMAAELRSINDKKDAALIRTDPSNFSEISVGRAYIKCYQEIS